MKQESKDQPAAAWDDSSLSGPEFQKKVTVLLVDDEPSIRQTAGECLRAAGHEVLIAASAGEAESHFRGYDIDVAVVDVVLEGEDGFSVARRLREFCPNTQILFFTGVEEIASAREAIHLHAFDYLVKPVARGQLVDVVGRAAAEKKRRDEHDWLQNEKRLYAKRLEDLVAKRTQALTRQTFRLKSLLDAIPDLVFRMGRPGTFLDFKPAAGVNPFPAAEELIGKSHHGVLPPEASAATDRAVVEALRTGETQGFEYRMVTGGVTHDYEARIAKASDDEVVAVIRDVSSRKRAEMERERLLSIIEESSDFIGSADMQGRIFYHNPAANRMLGLPEDADLSSISIGDMHPAWAARLIKDVGFPTALREGTWRGESAVLHRSGKEIPVSQVVVIHRDAHGNPRFSSTVARDITERKLAEGQVKAFSKKLIAAREDERKRVSEVLHHDVGSLAIGMSAHFDAIEDYVRAGNEAEACKWTELARKLLGASVGQLRQVAVDLRPPDLDVLGLGAALRQHVERLTGRGDVRITLTEDLGKRHMNRAASTVLFRVVQEALTNALRHGHAKEVDINLKAEKDGTRLEVRDNGKGFDVAGTRACDPARIGLRVMREMASGAGGVLTVESKPGQGTTVRAVLPRHVPEEKREIADANSRYDSR
jgi:PAS domain S-box-containing protein